MSCPPPQDIATGADSCVTSLTAGHLGESVVTAGFGDGCVRLYDHRMDNSEWYVTSLLLPWQSLDISPTIVQWMFTACVCVTIVMLPAVESAFDKI